MDAPLPPDLDNRVRTLLYRILEEQGIAVEQLRVSWCYPEAIGSMRPSPFIFDVYIDGKLLSVNRNRTVPTGEP